MPLDRVNGERIEGMHGPHIPVEARKLAEMTNLVTEYRVKAKFNYRTKTRPVFDDAVACAIDAFKAEGAMYPVRFDEDDVLVQVHPAEKKVSVMFQRRIAGHDYYVTKLYDLPAPVMESLLDGKKVITH